MKVYIIGAGGGGSWLVPSMCMLVGKRNVVVIDRDTLTRKNLNRQLFTDKEIGQNKAKALSEKYGCDYIEKWYTFGCMDHRRDDWLISCADNHPCRLAIIRAADQFGCQVLVAANEKTSAEGYYYRRDWRDKPTDPRVYYPDIVNDTSDDPSRPETCTGEAQQATPQLVSANVMAISLVQWLYVFWAMKRPQIDANIDEGTFPYLLRANMTRLETFAIKDAYERTDVRGVVEQPVADGSAS